MKSLFSKILIILFLVFSLMIPIYMIQNLSEERKARKNDVIYSLANTWGKENKIIDPAIEIIKTKQDANNIFLFPEDIEITGEIKAEIRYKGIFKVPFYTGNLKLKAIYDIKELPTLKDKKQKLFARFNFLSYNKSFLKLSNLKWNDSDIAIKDKSNNFDKIVLYLPNPKEGSNTLNVDIKIQGTQKIEFLPLSKKSKVSLKSNWISPNFAGIQLPLDRKISKEGFDATWEILNPVVITGDYAMPSMPHQSFEVSFFVPIDVYQLTQRSMKYSILFLTLTFVIFFLFEVMNPIRIHPMQYILVGFAMCLFYLLLLSLSEHVEFIYSFVIASIATISLITMYSLKVLKNFSRSMVMGSFLILLYFFLYVLLQMEEYSLLLGSAALFLILASIMYVTREIDWYSLSIDEEGPSDEQK